MAAVYRTEEQLAEGKREINEVVKKIDDVKVMEKLLV